MPEPHGSGLAVGDEVERRGHRHRARRPLRRPPRRPGALRPPHHPRRAGARSGHRDRRRRAVPACGCRQRRHAVARPGASAVPVRRAGPVRRLRLPARGAAPTARAQGRGRPRAAAAGWPTWTSRSTSSRCPATTRPRLAHPGGVRVDGEGRRGLRRHRSHDVVEVDHCRIAAPGIDRLRVTEQRWPGADAVDAVAPSVGEPLAVARRPAPTCRSCTSGSTPPGAAPTAASSRWRASSRCRPEASGRCTPARPAPSSRPCSTARRRARGSVPSTCTPGWACSRAPGRCRRVRPGRSSPSSPTREAVEHARHNLADRRQRCRARPATGRRRLRGGPPVAPRQRRQRVRRRASRPASRWLPTRPTSSCSTRRAPVPDAGVCAAVAALRPRAVVYVACDPAALARDTAYLGRAGYRLRGLRAFDAFPMTHHVECVARFVPA